ncbi:MAG: hypothetical protein MUO99_07210 [Dehalococcoidales bacterium]|nr:hypothetical protein [Dehalococcoidales bacterium]
MTSFNIKRLFKVDYLLLLLALGLAFYIAFIPHQNYPYPLHVDEWVHLANSQAMLQAGNTSYVEPFYGGATIGLGSNLEASFHLFWGTFQSISGLSWLTIFRYFPGIILMLTVLAVYVLAKREGFGWEAAFFTALIPTTVGILGPSFLVPATLGLLFTPLIIFLAFNLSTIWSYLLIFVLTSFLLAIHAPSAIYPILILAPYILLNLKGNFKHSLGIALALALPFLVVFPWIFDLLAPTFKSLFTSHPPTEYVQLPRVIETYGYLPTLFSLLGIFLLARQGGRKNYGLILGLLVLLLMLVTFYTFHYGVPIVYERGLLYLMLMMSLVAGAGLAGVKNLILPAKLSNWLKAPIASQYLGKFLCLALIGVTLAVTVPARQNTPYYHMIDSEDYQAFIWIKDNVGKEYDKAILDPWKATAFTAITGKKVYTRIHAYPTAKDNEAYDFLSGGSSNTTFLRGNGISIVYTRIYESGPSPQVEYESHNADLVPLARNIYLLR